MTPTRAKPCPPSTPPATGGAPVTELRLSGGDARLASWNRIKADLLGIPVVRIPGDAAGTGVAMLAGIGAGVFRDAAEAIVRRTAKGGAA